MSGRCGQCINNADCADQPMTRCNTLSNVCELCGDDNECTAGVGDTCGGDGRCTCQSFEECWSSYSWGVCE